MNKILPTTILGMGLQLALLVSLAGCTIFGDVVYNHNGDNNVTGNTVNADNIGNDPVLENLKKNKTSLPSDETNYNLFNDYINISTGKFKYGSSIIIQKPPINEFINPKDHLPEGILTYRGNWQYGSYILEANFHSQIGEFKDSIVGFVDINSNGQFGTFGKHYIDYRLTTERGKEAMVGHFYNDNTFESILWTQGKDNYQKITGTRQ